MIHELFCVGRFTRCSEDDTQAMLERARRALSPAVEMPITEEELRITARAIGQPESMHALENFLRDNGMAFVEGYLDVLCDRLQPAGKQFIEELCRAKRCQIINCLGRFVSYETLIETSSEMRGDHG